MASIHVRTTVVCSALLIFVSVLLLPPAYADELNGSLELARNHASTREELLLFYEEKDLFVATKRPTSLKKAPAIATVVTAEEIRNMGARNLSDVLKMAPGFGVSINEFGWYMFEVRGIRTYYSEKVLVMIDGHRLNQPYTGGALDYVFNDLSVEKIKQLEIIRGPGSALHGANAFVAVINVVTKRADDINGVAATAGAGSNDTWKGNVQAGQAIDELAVMGDIDYLRTDGQKLFIEKDRLAGTPSSAAPGYTSEALEKSDLFVKGTWGELSLRSHYVHKRRDAYIGINYALTDENDVDLTYFWSELEYLKKLTGAFNLRARAYVDYFKHDVFVEIFPEGFMGVYPDGMLGNAMLKDRILGGEVQLEYALFDANVLTFGAQVEQIRQYDVTHNTNFDPLTGAPLPSFQDISAWGNFNQNAKRNVSALFLQDEWGLRENLFLTVGARYDHYSDFGDALSPRAGLVWEAFRNGEFKLLYGRAFRAPNFVEMYNVNNPVIIGNPDLKPERIETYEAAFGYRWSDPLRVSLNYFHSAIDDLITRDAATTPALYVNRGGAKIQGLELELTGQYTHSNYWKLSYTYQQPEDSDTGQRLPDVPQQRATAMINYGITRFVNANLGLLWTGPRARTSSDTRGKLPSFITADAALIARNIIKDLDVSLSVHNLLNKKYQDPDTSGANQYVPGDFPREGVFTMAGLQYRF